MNQITNKEYCIICWKMIQAEPEGDKFIFNSPLAGGKYSVDRQEYYQREEGLIKLHTKDTVRLSGHIAKQNLLDKIPDVSSMMKDTKWLEKLPPIPGPTERAYLLLEGLVKKTKYFGQEFNLNSLELPKIDDSDIYGFLHAISYSDNKRPEEIKSLIEFLAELNFIKINVTIFKVTAQGFEKIDQLSQNNYSRKVFIAMWFDDSMNALKDSMKKAIKNLGYEPSRIDDKEHLNKIDDEILLEIKKSRFVICDLTSEKEKPRGSVYFEAGYAMGKDIPIIWTCNKSLEKERAFDIQNYNCLFWEKDNLDNFIKKLEHRIEQTIGKLTKGENNGYL
ncbi:MAG: hypothetical protein GDA46_04385 [Bdellovibrionales bacterium]|nr:hypothetical protein [Bdellovibrionales bacterium]